jgi:hypothetical protein
VTRSAPSIIGIIASRSFGSYEQSQSIDATTSVGEARSPVRMAAATPAFFAWRSTWQSGKSRKRSVSRSQVASELPSSTRLKWMR